MIGYADTSALVPLLIAEPGSAACQRFWQMADTVVTCRLAYVEAAAALGQAHRLGRVDDAEHRASRQRLDDLWEQVEIVEIDDLLVRYAAELAPRFELRGYDAVHCASAALLAESELVAGSGDQRLLAAWHQLGIATFDSNGVADTEP